MVGLFEDDDSDDLLELRGLQAAVGDCIHSWCCLEGSLVSVLSWALNAPYHKSEVVFRGINGFGLKLAIVDELMLDEFDGLPENKFWLGMCSNLKALATARNTLAHFSPYHEFDPVSEKFKGVVSRRRYGKQERGFTLTGIQCLVAAIKCHAELLDGLVCHLDETRLNERVYRNELKPIKFVDKMVAMKPSPKRRSRIREKEEPARWFSISPETSDEQMAEFLDTAGKAAKR